MKVVLVNTLYPPYLVGGAERSVQLLAEGLLAKGHEPVVITLQEPWRGVAVHEVNRVRVYRIGLPNIYWPFAPRVQKPSLLLRLIWQAVDRENPIAARLVQGVLQRERPEIVHTHNLTGFSTAVWRVALRLGMPVVHTVRDYGLICPRGMYKGETNCRTVCSACKAFGFVARKMSNRIQAVVGVSNFALKRHEQAGFFARVSLKKVIYNPVVSGLRVVRDSPAAGSSKDVLRIGYIGRLEPAKGIEDLIRAYRVVAEQGLQLRLIIAGRGYESYESALRKMTDGIDSVDWLGFVDPSQFYQDVDVVVVPSRWEEPFGRTVIEALSYGIPVIAARRGGIPEIIRDGENGWLYDPDEPQQLAKLIELLPQRYELLAEMRQRARVASEAFSVSRHVSQYEGLYQEVHYA